MTSIERYQELFNLWMKDPALVDKTKLMLLAADLRWDLEEAYSRLYELEETLDGRG